MNLFYSAFGFFRYHSSMKNSYYVFMITFLFFSLIIAHPVLLKAAPSVDNTIGDITNNSLIKITGVNFGFAPNVVFFDDFEKGSNGAKILTGANSATFGQIYRVQNKVYYTNTTSVSGSLAFQANMDTNSGNSVVVALPSNTEDIFISWWLYLPSGDNFPGDTSSNGINWKQMWVLGKDVGTDDLVVPSLVGYNWIINGNDPNPGYVKTVTSGMQFKKGEWKRLSMWLKGGYQNDGQVHFWSQNSTGWTKILNDNNVDTLKNGGTRKTVDINAFGRVTPNCHPTFDDVYICLLYTSPSPRD